MVSHVCLHEQPPVKLLDTKAQVSFLVSNILCMFLGELSTVAKTLLGEKNWKLMPGISWTLPYNVFIC